MLSALLKNTRVWQRLTFVAVGFILPVVVLMHLVGATLTKDVEFAQRQRTGLEYLRPVQKLYVDLESHRAIVAGRTDADATFKDRLGEKQMEIENDLKALEDANGKWGAGFGVGPAHDAVKGSWQATKAGAWGATDASLAQHRELLGRTRQLVARAANGSGLVRVADLDAYHTMDALVNRLPGLVDQLEETRVVGTRALLRASTGEPTPAERVELSAMTARARESLAATTESLRYGFDANSQLAGTLKPLADIAQSGSLEFLDAAEAKILKSAIPSIGDRDFAASGARASDASAKLLEAVVVAHDQLLVARIDRLDKIKYSTLLAIGGGVAAPLLVLYIILLSITRPLASLGAAAEKISLGDLEAKIETDRKDEFGELGERFQRMQTSLKAAMERLDEV